MNLPPGREFKYGTYLSSYLSNYVNTYASQFYLYPTATSDTMTLAVPANVAQDRYGRGNPAATCTVTDIDYIRPTIVRIDTPEGLQSGEFDITIVWSEDIIRPNVGRVGMNVVDYSRHELFLTTTGRIDGSKLILTCSPLDPPGYWKRQLEIRVHYIHIGAVADAARGNHCSSYGFSGKPSLPSHDSVVVFKLTPHDMDKDGDVDIDDVRIVVLAIGQSGDDIDDPRTDVDNDDDVDKDDIIAVIDNVDDTAAPPSADIFTNLSPGHVF